MTTTFSAIRPLIKGVIEALTPSATAHIKFREAPDSEALELHIGDFSILRKFQLESGGIPAEPSVFTASLYRDTQKELIIKIGYPNADNNTAMQDLADDDENQIIRALENPDNIAAVGAWNISLNGSRPEITEERLINYISMRVHFNHSA